MHDSRELSWVVIEFAQQGFIVVAHIIFSLLCELVLNLTLLLLLLQSFFDGSICVNNERYDDVEEEKVRHLHERNEEKQYESVSIVFERNLVHKYKLFPIILPHESKQCVHGHYEIVEV